jgi:nitrogen fixation/metabolism regulation signal transduction histidine kinase
VRILANPIFLRAAVVFICATSAFLIAVIFMRKLRQSIHDEADISSGPSTSLETLPLHLYSTVIQELKQQKHELLVQSQAEQHRARTTDTFGHAVLSNLSSGVLVFGMNGLVKSSNPAAKDILGFASTTGMNAESIFRGAMVSRDAAAPGGISSVSVADEVDAVLREGSARRRVEAEYETPAGEERFIAVTVSPIPGADPGADADLLGIVCLINDLSELARARRQLELQAEISAEMALKLHTSLATISSCAQQLAGSHDAERSRRLASDITEEAAQLEATLGGFLSDKAAARSAVAGAGSATTNS